MSVQTKKKTTIGIAVAAVSVAAIAIGVGTFAAFSDTGDANPTTASAATLELDDTFTEGDVNFLNLVPSDTVVKTNTLELTTSGTVEGDLILTNAVTDIENGCNGDEKLVDNAGENNCNNLNGPGDLSSKLLVKVTKTVGNGDPAVVYNNLPVSGLATTSVLDELGVPAGTTVMYTFVYTFPEGGANDNIAQGDSTTVTTTATLQQS